MGGRLRTAQSLVAHGLLVERAPRRFGRTSDGQTIMDWRDMEDEVARGNP